MTDTIYGVEVRLYSVARERVPIGTIVPVVEHKENTITMTIGQSCDRAIAEAAMKACFEAVWAMPPFKLPEVTR